MAYLKKKRALDELLIFLGVDGFLVDVVELYVLHIMFLL
jgi:hypothetical protein